jgi:RNA polymerase sigma-70 factor, ECF subfamily
MQGSSQVPSDGTLLDAWRRGDPAAFDALVERHERALLAHARSMVGAGGAPDAAQETLVRLARKPPSVPEGVRGDADGERAALAGWLHRVLRRVCLDQVRAERRRRRREREAAAVEAVAGGQESVEHGELREVVERELGRLPEAQREVLVLRLFGERSYREIAEITGKKVGTVGWLISAGLARLAEGLLPLVTPEQGAREAQVGWTEQ